MFRFENPEYFILFFALPFLVLAYYLFNRNRRKRNEVIIDQSLFDQLARNFSARKSRFSFFSFFMVVTLLVMALINPQWSKKRENVEKKSSDIYIALDISRSMMC